MALRATEQPINTGAAAGKAFLDMLGVFAEFETNLRKERQAEGIASAKARGVYKGESRKSIPWSSTSFGTMRSSVRLILRDGSALAGQAFIACLGRRGQHSHANPPGVATTLSPALARIEQPRPLRTRRRKVSALWPTQSRPPPLPAGRALVRRTSGDLAGSPWTSCPLARPCGGNSVPDNARRARSGAPGQRSHQQSAEKSAGPLSALPHAARSAAPSGAAPGHLPAASGIRRSLPRSISSIDRRTHSETASRSNGPSSATGLMSGDERRGTTPPRPSSTTDQRQEAGISWSPR